MANARNTTRVTRISQNQPQSTAVTQADLAQNQPTMTATENLSQRQDRMEETLMNLQQKGIQILETKRCGQPRTQQEHHEDRISKGKGKVTNLPSESGTKSSSTNRDRGQSSHKSTDSQDRLNSERRRPSRSVFERISRKSRQDPADLRQYLERRRSHDRSASHHNDQSRARAAISSFGSILSLTSRNLVTCGLLPKGAAFPDPPVRSSRPYTFVQTFELFDFSRLELFDSFVNRLSGRLTYTIRILRDGFLELFDFLLEVILLELLLGQFFKQSLPLQVKSSSLLLPSLLRILECLGHLFNFFGLLQAFEDRVVH
ncbi:hypothetical protein PanWU01x14_272220 [Parasponia andersonii]|uniref:Uncharacterized protein n=1 Tax=Parasponia andersonii TaxID=3476 RepID=A0A2P5B4I6_PARAD|nr:hypothetical protein PanWU01x14_272220 [Parasponia andersonii]